MHKHLNIRMENQHSMKRQKMKNKKTKTKTFHHAVPLLDSSFIPVLTCHGFRIQKNQNP